MSFLLDTNVVSKATRPRADPRVAEWLKSLAEGQTFISVITVAELKRGVSVVPLGNRRSGLTEWVQVELVERYGDRLLPITTHIAETWDQLTADLQRAGTPTDSGRISRRDRRCSFAYGRDAQRARLRARRRDRVRSLEILTAFREPL